MIYGDIREQNLMLRVNAVADTIDYLTARFIFHTADWDNLTIYAHFKQGDTIYSVQLTDGKITEADHLNLGAGEWELYLHGNEYKNGDVIKRITTNIQKFVVEPTGVLNGEPFPEAEPSIVEELLAETSDHEDRIVVLEDIVDTEVKGVSIGSGARLIATGQEVYDTYYHTGTTNLMNGPTRVIRMRINQQDSTLEFFAVRRITDVENQEIVIEKYSAALDSNIARRIARTHAIPTYEQLQSLITKGEIAEGNDNYVVGGDVFAELSGKQDTLTAGANITIEDNVISATGGGASVQSDWSQSDTIAPDYIKNKPDLSVYAESSDLASVATSGDYTDLSNTPDLSVYAETSDLATVATSGAYSDLSGTPSLANVATSGDYDDLINKPTIPDPQIQADWNEADSTKADFIKNKPTIPTVPVTDVQDSNGTSLVSGGIATIPNGGFIAQSTAPSDTSLLWIDIDDNTIDETLANGDTSSY